MMRTFGLRLDHVPAAVTRSNRNLWVGQSEGIQAP